MIKKTLALFPNLIKNIKRSRIRRIMRGYLKLKKLNQLRRITEVQNELTELQLDIPKQYFSEYLMGAGFEVGEIIIRQYLLVRIAGLKLNSAILLAYGKSNGKVIYPLPKEWRVVLKRHGFNVAELRSAFLWWGYIFCAYIYGLLITAKIIFNGKLLANYCNSEYKKYIYFANLNFGNLPQNSFSKGNHDLISWYLNWRGAARDTKSIHHSVTNFVDKKVNEIEIVYQRDVLPDLVTWKRIVKYAIWGAGACLLAILDILRGRWFHAFILNQSALAAQVRNLPINSLASQYYFHNSGWVYRPLWTYETEQLGSVTNFYFYSTNCEGYKTLAGYKKAYFGYKAMNWPRYLVWDGYQADFVKRVVTGNPKIEIVGPIGFQDSILELPKIINLGIAVFDITPIRTSYYYEHCEETDVLVPEFINPFLEQVSNAILKLDVLMLWKRKRNIGHRAHPKYRNLANRLAEQSHVVSIAPEISANKIIASSVAVISMPFTSTAIIAKEMSKPSIYYDPSGLLQKDDRGAHGIQIISSIDKLEEWLANIVAIN